MWTAVDVFMGFVIGPIMRSLSVPARIELTKGLMPKMRYQVALEWLPRTLEHA